MVCDMYGIDPMDIKSDKEVEYFIEMNNVKDIYELYDLLFEEQIEEQEAEELSIKF